jgi:hypothetical protein
MIQHLSLCVPTIPEVLPSSETARKVAIADFLSQIYDETDELERRANST